MNDRQRELLLGCGIDVDGAVYRFGGREDIYIACLDAFLEDPSMPAFKAAMERGAWEEACSAAHTLKGAAGNMGFTPLMDAAQQAVTLLRGQSGDIASAAAQLESRYQDVAEGIHGFFAAGIAP